MQEGLPGFLKLVGCLTKFFKLYISIKSLIAASEDSALKSGIIIKFSYFDDYKLIFLPRALK